MNCKIGIPRALLFYYYYPAWKTFFEELGAKIVLSPTTNKRIVDKGIDLAVDDLCLPFKVYFGHVFELLNNNIDFIFAPKLYSLGKNNAVCPKFMGLPEMLKATFDNLPPMIAHEINLKKRIFPLRRFYYNTGKQLDKKLWEIEKAYRKARKVQSSFEKFMVEKGYTPLAALQLYTQKNEDIVNNRKDNKESEKKKEFKIEDQLAEKNNEKIDLKIAVLGHSYIVNDKYLSMSLIDHLRNMGVKVVTHEMIAEDRREKASRYQNKNSFWFFNRQIMGAAYHIVHQLKSKIDGIIQITSFGCGPDSLIKEIVSLNVKNNDDNFLLNIDLDEHSGEAGLITRLEAFIDLLKRRNNYEKDYNLSPPG